MHTSKIRSKRNTIPRDTPLFIQLSFINTTFSGREERDILFVVTSDASNNKVLPGSYILGISFGFVPFSTRIAVS